MKEMITLLAKGGICRIVLDLLCNSDEHKVIQICDDYNLGEDELHGFIPCNNTISEYVDRCIPGDLFFNCIGNYQAMKSRFIYSTKLRRKGCVSFNIIHPNAIVSDRAQVGNGILIMPNVVVNTNAVIGNDSILFSGSILEHDCIIGNNVYISPSVTLCGKVTIGNNVYIGPGAIVAAGVHIGSNSVIGAASTVLNDIDSGSVVYGQPAKFIRKNLLW